MSLDEKMSQARRPDLPQTPVGMTIRTIKLLNALNLGLMMLGVEARAHRENQEPKKAEAVEGAMRVMQAALDEAAGGLTREDS